MIDTENNTIIYTDKDVQRILGFSKSKMQTIRLNNIIPFTKVGKSYFILKTDFEQWLSANKGKSVM